MTRMEELPPEDGGTAAGGGDVGDSYLATVMRWSREIVVITLAVALLAGLAAFAANKLLEPQYKASADVAIVRTVSQLNFDQRFTTTSDEATMGDSSLVVARRNALVGLAESPAIAARIIESLGDVLNAKERVPTNLVRKVKATMVNPTGRPSDSDLIRITVTADGPAKAARIATAWAETYVNQVNLIYGQAPDELLASVGAQQAQAKTAYEKAQAELERFTADNRLDELNRQITEKQGIINQIVKARAEVAAAYLDAETQTRAARFERWLQVTTALDQARTLRGQVAAGGGASTGGGALVAELLKLQALTQVLDESPRTAPSVPSAATQSTAAKSAPSQSASPGPVEVRVNTTPLQIQLNADSAVSQDALLADIDAFVQALDQRRAELENQIAAPGEQSISADKAAYLGQAASGVLSNTEGSGLLDSTVRGLEDEVRALKAQLETESARDKQLVQERDLAWDTLNTVSSKVAELAVSRAAADSQVRFAAAAVPSAQPESRFGTAKAILLGGMLGLLVGVCIALAATAMGKAPFFSRGRARA